jgi:thymidylate kinase
VPDRMEHEAVEFYERVCAAYQKLAARAPERIQLIDAARTAGEVETEIWQVLSQKFGDALVQSRSAISSTKD